MIKKAERELDLREMLTFLWQHVGAVLLCAVMVAVGCVIITTYKASKNATYEASALMRFDTNLSNSDSSTETRFQFYSNIANMSSIIVESDELLSRVADNLALPMDAAELKPLVDLESVNSSSFMRLTVTGTDEGVTRKICEEILAVAPEVSEQMTGLGTLEKASEVQVSAPQAQKPFKAGFVGALLGVIFSILVLIGIELFDHRIQDAGDVQYYLDMKPLQVIPAGCGTETMQEAYRTLCIELRELLPENGGVVLLSSAGNSVDNADLAKSLGESFTETGKKVLLVDGNLREGNLSKQMGANNASGLSELLMHQVNQDVVMRSIEENKLALLPSGTTSEHLAALLTEENIKDLFAELREKFDYIVISAPDITAVSDAVLLSTAADGVLLAIQAGKTEIETALLAKEKLSCGRAPIWGGVLTGYDWKRAKRRDGYYYAFSAARRS